MIRIVQVLVLSLTLSLGLLSHGVAWAQSEFRGFSEPELDQMLAPVALYPDTVLSHVLIAATYPIEVVQAARWARQNPGLRGEQAVNSVIGQDWDPSVMALVAFPDLLARMDADLDWTQRLGDAFMIQEAEVLDSIQRLRGQAFHSGHLRSSEHVQVVREREVIYIEPPRRQVVFVPVYDTRVVYGAWAWAHHPPVFWYPPRRHRLAVYWGPAFHVPSAFFFSSFHWSQRQVVVVHHHHHYFRPHHPRPRTVVHHHHYNGRDLARHEAAQRWQHDPGHRRGVAYHPAVDERHRQLERRAGPQSAARTAAPMTDRAAPPVRVADTRNSQREWAATRRAEAMLPQSGAAQARSGASATARRGDENLRLSPASASVQRNADGRASRTTEQQAPVRPAARSIERQIQGRAATQNQARTGISRSSSVTAPTSAPRSQQAPGAAPRMERQPQRAAGLEARAATATHRTAPAAASRPAELRVAPRSGSVSPSARPAAAPQAQPPRASAAPAPRSSPPRSAAPAPGRVPDSRPAATIRPAAQRQSRPTTSTRTETSSATERRAARRVD